MWHLLPARRMFFGSSWCKAASLCSFMFVAAASAQSLAPRIDLELSGGAGVSQHIVVAPTVSARAGIDLWEVFTVSLRGFGVVGQLGESRGDGDDPLPGYRGWAVFPEVRVHRSGGSLQPFAAVGLGVGQLVNAQCYCNEITFWHGDPSAFFQTSAGAAWWFGPVSVGLEVGIQLFTGVQGGDSSWSLIPSAEETRKKPFYGGFAHLTVGGRLPWP